MTIIEEIIKSYNPKTNDEAKYVLRELLQQIVLIGLSRSDFFKYASFYGGTALRIFYGLNRYSEDLDFSLNSNSKDELFSFTPFIEKIKEVALSYDLNLENSQKDKKIKTNIESAFAKINTYQTFLSINLNKTILGLIHKDEVIKVKFKIDCNPALGFNTESKWLDIPEFAPVTVLDLPSLFAGKEDFHFDLDFSVSDTAEIGNAADDIIERAEGIICGELEYAVKTRYGIENAKIELTLDMADI